MKGIFVDTAGKIEVRDFEEPLYETIGEAVKGYIEVVHPAKLINPYVMVVNEEGLLLSLDFNPIGSYIYGFFTHGYPILGNAVFMKTGYNADGEPDIIGLEDDDIKFLLDYFNSFEVRAVK